MILVDHREIEDRVFTPTMMGCWVKWRLGSALRIYPRRSISSGFKGEDPCHVGCERKRLQVEHELHVLREGVGNTRWSSWQSTLLSRTVLCLNSLDTTFDLSNVV